MSTEAKSASQSEIESAGQTGAASNPTELTLEVTLKVNGDRISVPSPCTIITLLEHVGFGGKRVAVAVNRDVVIRGHHAEHTLSDGDHIEILEAVGGG